MFWAFWDDKRKIEKNQNNEICNRKADLPCWWPRICWKTFFQLPSSKFGTKKNSTCYSKNIDRILKCLDRLRSNFYKLANLRLTTFTYWKPGSWPWIWRLFFEIVDILILQILFSVSSLSICIINSLTRPSPLLLT